MTGPDDRPIGQLFAALADGTRRSVIERLAQRGAASATRLAVDSTVSRQAITKHLQVLSDAGLVVARRRGRETMWSLAPDQLAPVLAWLRHFGAPDGDRLQD